MKFVKLWVLDSMRGQIIKRNDNFNNHLQVCYILSFKMKSQSSKLVIWDGRNEMYGKREYQYRNVLSIYKMNLMPLLVLIT